MIRFLLFLFLAIIPQWAAAQAGITGRYNMGSSSPEGGTHLFVLDNHRFAVVYFGGAKAGSWEISNDSLVTFTPFYEPEHFVLYGRYNKDLHDSLRIHFRGFSDEETFIKTGRPETGQPLLRRVFNPEPNCFGYPYVYKFKKQSDTLCFTFLPYAEERPKQHKSLLYTFVYDKRYNDFIANYVQERRDNQPFYAVIRKNGLAFKNDRVAQKTPLDLKGEDVTAINGLTASTITPGTIYTNPWYNQYHEDIKKDIDFKYDRQKDAYINTLNYKEGEEYVKGDNGYNTMNVIYPFEKVTHYTKTATSFRINEKPLFFVTCK